MSDSANDGRPETEDQRLDRNWSELLQEVRVAQTGTQILTGFLLTLAFQQRFTDLNAMQVDIYLALVIVSGLTTALALAPVALHRALFREGAKEWIVRTTDHLVKATLVGVGLALTGTVLLIFDVVLGLAPGITAAAITAVLTVLIWLVLPVFAHRRQ